MPNPAVIVGAATSLRESRRAIIAVVVALMLLLTCCCGSTISLFSGLIPYAFFLDDAARDELIQGYVELQDEIRDEVSAVALQTGIDNLPPWPAHDKATCGGTITTTSGGKTTTTHDDNLCSWQSPPPPEQRVTVNVSSPGWQWLLAIGTVMAGNELTEKSPKQTLAMRGQVKSLVMGLMGYEVAPTGQYRVTVSTQYETNLKTIAPMLTLKGGSKNPYAKDTAVWLEEIYSTILSLTAGPSGGFGDASMLTGNQKIIAEYLLGKGLKPLQVAAVMGNIYGESGYVTDKVEGGTGWGYGLCQWTNWPLGSDTGRRKNLELYAASKNKPASDINVQLDLLWAEMSGAPPCGSYGICGQWGIHRLTRMSTSQFGFITKTDIADATLYFMWGWERPDETNPHVLASQQTRINEAKRVYALLQTGSGQLTFPVKGSWNLSCPLNCGCSIHGGKHEGQDFGTGGASPPIVAARGGKVTYAGWNGGYGNHVRIDHGGGMVTTYSHLNVLSVSTGQTVNAGQQIGLCGSTGFSFGNHLHFEVMVNGAFQDPMKYLK